MASSSCLEAGSGRAARRRRWCSWAGVVVVAGSDDEAAEGEGASRRERTDQVGRESISCAADDEALRR